MNFKDKQAEKMLELIIYFLLSVVFLVFFLKIMFD